MTTTTGIRSRRQELAPARNPVPEHVRALLIIPGTEDDNSYIFSRRQAKMLPQAQVDVRVFFLRSRTSARALIAEFLKIRKDIRAFNPQVIHAQYGTMTAFFAALATSLPLVITFRGSDLNPEPSAGRIRVACSHALSQLAALRAQRTICVSEELRNHLWWRKSRSFVITGGVNLELFKPIPRHEARRALGLITEAPIVLFNAGRAPRVKRLDLAELSIAEARCMRPDIIFQPLFGDVDPDRMPLYHSAADCLLITSDLEGSPTIVKEALACNLPVVSVDVGDVRQRLKGVFPSATTSSRDPGEIGRELVNVLNTNRRCNGRESVAGLTEQQEVRLIREIYDAILRPAK